MRGIFGFSLLTLAVAFGFTVFANEKPTMEYQDIMKSNAATNGAKLDLEYRPPGALPIKPGVIFFKVVRTPEYWNDIAGTGTIAIYQPIDPQGVTLHLYAVDPTNLQ